ncbi:MAG: hypothetical protein OXF33_07695 [Rhodospirillales bacterium]|nr:hypothetical protein [Rhodospirillales bacterium]
MHGTQESLQAPAGSGLTVLLRAPDPSGSDLTDDVELHTAPHLEALEDPWPNRPYREGYGWPVWIPPTSARAYISGSFALNLPTVPDEPELGDWHKDGAWWSPVYLDGEDCPVRAPVWGPDGTAIAAPGPPVLRDARPALVQVGHPAARRGTPVLAASVPQAIADMAWGSLHGTDQEPSRHDVFRWTDTQTEEELQALAHTIEARVRNPALRERWRRWRTAALHGPDGFLDTPVTTRLPDTTAATVRVALVHEPANG